MTDHQTALFPSGSPKEAKRKAKSLPKVERPAVNPRAAPAPLPPAAAAARDKALASVRSARARARVGDLRMSDRPCPDCGAERVEELVGITAERGFTWENRCLKCNLK
jgi:hypothetical protein